jgi:4-hydroxyphenylpyruvate dioxygenase
MTKKANSAVHEPKAVFSSSKQIDDPLGIHAIDSVEIWCGNARQAVGYYLSHFGFRPKAYRGPETGYFEAASYVLQQGKVRLVLSTPLRMTSLMNHSLLVHGDSVSDIALEVDDCHAFFTEAVQRGASVVHPPLEWSDEKGTLRRAAIRTYGDVIHSLVERSQYSGLYFPGFEPYEEHFQAPAENAPVGIAAIDHIVGNVELGQMDRWVGFYEQTLGFREMLHFSDEQISTEYSALMSKVVRNGSGKIKFPLNEPAQGKRKSQIEEYLDFHNGPGVQHIALITKDIVATVRELRRRGVNFLRVPKEYYQDLPTRVGSIRENLEAIAELGILADRDDDGYLLQIFTKPVEDRPTLFFEIIQRQGSQGFGVGNFKALFEAIEREQGRRGNL